jgi:hypothetical protein
VKTIKYECLNQFVIFGERHLSHLIKEIQASGHALTEPADSPAMVTL